TLRLVFADWLEERSDPRGELIRAWFDLREASHVFQEPLDHLTNIQDPLDERYNDALAFWEAAGAYRRLALAVDRDWLWRLGAVRPWLDRDLGLLIARCIVWEGGLDPRILVEEPGAKLERAWMFCYDGPDAPARIGSKD